MNRNWDDVTNTTWTEMHKRVMVVKQLEERWIGEEHRGWPGWDRGINTLTLVRRWLWKASLLSIWHWQSIGSIDLCATVDPSSRPFANRLGCLRQARVRPICRRSWASDSSSWWCWGTKVMVSCCWTLSTCFYGITL